MKVVFDLDGTLSDSSHRAHHLQKEPKDWDAWHAECGEDEPVWPLVRVCAGAAANYDMEVEIWTGRSESVQGASERWLSSAFSRVAETYPVNVPTIRMRPIGDHRPDYELKHEWAKTYGWPDLVFEDRQRVVDMWRAHGVTCCQVAPGDF